MILNALELLNRLVQVGGHLLVNVCRIVALYVVRNPATATQKLLQFLAVDPEQDSGINDLVAVDMKYRQECFVSDGVQEIRRVSRGG